MTLEEAKKEIEKHLDKYKYGFERWDGSLCKLPQDDRFVIGIIDGFETALRILNEVNHDA